MILFAWLLTQNSINVDQKGQSSLSKLLKDSSKGIEAPLISRRVLLYILACGVACGCSLIAIIPLRQADYPILLQRSFFFFARRSCSEQSTFHGQASDRVWFFPNCSFKASRKKKVSPFPLSSPPRVINELNSPVISRHTLLSVARKFCCKGAEGGGCAQDGAAMELSILEGELTEP